MLGDTSYSRHLPRLALNILAALIQIGSSHVQAQSRSFRLVHLGVKNGKREFVFLYPAPMICFKDLHEFPFNAVCPDIRSVSRKISSHVQGVNAVSYWRTIWLGIPILPINAEISISE